MKLYEFQDFIFMNDLMNIPLIGYDIILKTNLTKPLYKRLFDTCCNDDDIVLSFKYKREMSSVNTLRISYVKLGEMFYRPIYNDYEIRNVVLYFAEIHKIDENLERLFKRAKIKYNKKQLYFHNRMNYSTIIHVLHI